MTTISPLVESKLERRFHTYDTDGNGVIERRDFELVPERVAMAFGLPADDRRIIQLRAVLLGVWSRLAETSDSDGDGRITMEEYKTGFAQHVLIDQQAYARAYQPFIDTMMEIADVDGNGRVTSDEYVRWYTALMCISPAEARESFTHLDRDGDGAITHQEMTDAVLEYYFSEDPDAPGNWMTGRPPFSA
jgi:Ca2+-binding EF-hand superfamily protein